MAWLRRLFRWTRRYDRALADELEAHRAIVQDGLERAGLAPADAAAESRRRMGNVTLAREDAREVWIVRSADRLRQYLRYGVRGLRREPAFALTSILTLALGCAATTTVFSVVDAELWRPLPYPDPHRLFVVITRPPAPRDDVDDISLAELTNWRSRIRAFSSVAADGSNRRRVLQLADHAESIRTEEVTANYFTTLGRPAVLGRAFADADARDSNIAVLTERGWRRAFEADPSIVGRVITLDSRAETIVGVVVDDDTIGTEPDLFLPIDESAVPAAGQATRTVYGAIGRLTAEATPEVARQQLQAEVDRVAGTDPAMRGHRAVVEDLGAFYTTYDPQPLYFFLGASILVLALTVTNIAGLLLARILRRSPEFALRGALGGGGGALTMQLIVEAALIAIPGCTLGLVLTWQAVGLTSLVVPGDVLMRGTHVVVDLRAAAFSFAVALTTIGGLALVPRRLVRRASATAAMGLGSRTIGTASAGRARAALLAAQLALTVMLLTTAGVFLKSFAGLMQAPLGFSPDDGWSLNASLSGPRYASEATWRAYADRLSAQAKAIPGVRDATIATSSPLTSGWLVAATETGHPKAASGGRGGSPKTDAVFRAVDGEYFRTLGTSIVRGRGILPSDVAGAPNVAVVNEEFAQRMFPGGDVVGRQVDLEAQHAAGVRSGTVTIVGVASNIKEISPNESAFPDVYVPFAQRPASTLELVVRVSGQATDTEIATALRGAAARVDSGTPVLRLSSLPQRVTSSVRRDRFNLILVAGFAAVAVLIAAIGIYGAMAYAATARRREFGVRLALGATPRGLVGVALWHAARIGIFGGGIGLGCALPLAVWLGDRLSLVPGKHNGLLFNVTFADPLSLAAALAGVVVLALGAGAIPARRVARVDPVQALRAE